MSLSNFLLRFGLIHVVALFAVSTVLVLLEMESNLGVGISVLLGTVSAACLWFGKKNGRYFTRTERRAAFFGLVAIDAVVQTTSVLVAAGQGNASGLEVMWNSGLLWIITGMICAVHAGMIWFVMGSVGKQLAKQQIAKAAQAAG
jgi:uncharacterized membrane protein